MKNLLLALVATLLLAAGCDTLPDDGGMKFDDNQVCSVALYAKDYTLESNGSLHTVTLQYKLID